MKSQSITYEQDVLCSYTHGNKPNMDRSVLTILVQLTAISPFSLRALHLRSAAELPPMLTCSSNISGVHSQRPEEKGGKKTGRKKEKTSLKFFYLSAEDPVFETACKMDINMTHGFWIK